MQLTKEDALPGFKPHKYYYRFQYETKKGLLVANYATPPPPQEQAHEAEARADTAPAPKQTCEGGGDAAPTTSVPSGGGNVETANAGAPVASEPSASGVKRSQKDRLERLETLVSNLSRKVRMSEDELAELRQWKRSMPVSA